MFGASVSRADLRPPLPLALCCPWSRGNSLVNYELSQLASSLCAIPCTRKQHFSSGLKRASCDFLRSRNDQLLLLLFFERLDRARGSGRGGGEQLMQRVDQREGDTGDQHSDSRGEQQ